MNAQKARIACGLVLGGIVLVSGCTDRTKTPADSSAAATTSPADAPPTLGMTSSIASTNTEEHRHKPGAHGGIMISLGRDSYHVEAVFEKGGVLRLYTLGKDETRVIDVEKQTLRGFVKAEGDTDAQQFALDAEPQDADPEGRTSQFTGTLPKGMWGLSLEVTVPNIVISGERFRLGFKSTPEEHEEGMPDKEERKLYLTPGGKYTEADIKANGRMTATAKFKGLKSSHDLLPKPGDKVCPVTKTKANPKFSWIVDGETYEFCCPPCVDEFVKTAKKTPEEIGQPSDYVKQQ